MEGYLRQEGSEAVVEMAALIASINTSAMLTMTMLMCKRSACLIPKSKLTGANIHQEHSHLELSGQWKHQQVDQPIKFFFQTGD